MNWKRIRNIWSSTHFLFYFILGMIGGNFLNVPIVLSSWILGFSIVVIGAIILIALGIYIQEKADKEDRIQ